MKRFYYTLVFLWTCSFCPAQNCEGSLLFDDTNPAVDLPLTNHWYTGVNGGYTWECWFKLDQPFTSDIRPLISCVDLVVFEDMYLGFGWNGGFFNEPSTRLVFKVDGPSSTVPSGPNCSYAPPAGFVTGTWYHAAGVMNYTTQTAKLFVNGVLVDTKPVTTPPNNRAITGQLSFNYSWASAPNPLYGKMDEVRIWDRPLTDTEIAANYDKCMTGNEPNLYLYYRCNSTSATSVPDAGVNGNTGTFSLAPGWSTEEAPVNGTACSVGCSPCDRDFKIDVPNAFSPNGDGHNEYFLVEGWPDCATDFHLVIYDRWGEKVFETRNPQDKWDGTYREKPLDAGVFVYYLDAVLPNTKPFSRKGNISLLR